MTRFHPHRVRIATLLALALASAGCAAGSYLWYRIAPDYPADESGTIALPGLSAPVKVYLDKAGVAHIDAPAEEDLVRAAGFMQGRSRFFQMDMMRRFARGRLAELVGDRPILSGTTVELDRSMRGWGFEAAAREDVASLDPETRRLMTLFTEGVNAALARHEPIEYRLLGVEPEPWTIENSYALGRLNAWSVTHNWHQEASRLVLALHVGIDRAERIYDSEPLEGGWSLATPGEPHPLAPAIAPELRDVFPPRPPVLRQAAGGGPANRDLAADLAALARSGSNAWVVAGSRSESGKPILANDPHLMHLVPSIVFQQHLKAPGLDVIGVTIPGLPYVLAGHNQTVAWGMTSAVGDAVDLCVERTNPENPNEVLTPKGFEPIARENLVVRVRDGSKLIDRNFVLRRTRNGPLLNDIYPDLLPDWAPPVSVRWDAAGAGGSVRSIARGNRARTVGELREAFAGITTPIQTWTAADTTGTIAIFAAGRVPIREKHRGTFPIPGWLAEYDWKGTLDSDALPHGTDPASGFFAHGNNLMVDPTRDPVYRQIDSAPPYRYERIAELLGAEARHTSKSLARIQRDVRLLRAKRVVPFLLADLGTERGFSPVESGALALLRAWNFDATAGSAATAVFFTTYREAIIEALRDEVDEHGLEFILSQRYSTNVADLWFDSVDHPVWDDRATAAVEDRPAVVRAAFGRAVAGLAESQGSDPAGWRWGRLHDLSVQHPFGSQWALAGFVNLTRVEAAGALDSVWKSHFDLGSPEHPFRAIAGPVFRMVVDLADIEHARWIVDTGVSGWPGSPHYGDQHALWLGGEYLPMVSNWDEIRSSAAAVLTLE